MSVEDFDDEIPEDEWRWTDEIIVKCCSCSKRKAFWLFPDDPPVTPWKCDACRWADIQLRSIIDRERFLLRLRDDEEDEDDPYEPVH